ncbi:MAG TPA: DUF6065 family protein, partial [Candidatus Methylomirabilis sp.]|nr:DUF6065 family protein [Candidatus Methylomirabilis sp.]
MNHSRLEVMIYQIVDDTMLKKNRTDGTGWEWGWADLQRDWMDASPNRFAYRCLPLSIVNQTGWWIKNPVGFTATWRGVSLPGTIDFQFDGAPDTWSGWINNQFGGGIITWNTPFLFRTRPEGSRLLVCGPVNQFKTYAQPLTALIESDWMSMSFTMNWKIVLPNQPVRFDAGEPLFQAIPLVSNVCSDLEAASVTYQRLTEDPEVYRAYQAWNEGRRSFHAQKAKGEVKPDDWQKDYFHGRDALGQAPATVHMTKVKPPPVRFLPQALSSRETRPQPLAGSSAPSAVLGGPSGSAAGHPQASCPFSQQPQEHQTLSHQIGAEVAEARRAGPRMDDLVQTQTVATSATSVVMEQQPAPVPAPARASIRVNDDWRRWIAENLMLEGPPEVLLAVMKAAGIDHDEAAIEIQFAQQSPYLKGSELLRNRLRKRNWLIATYRKLNRLHPRSSEIERRHKLSRQELLSDYYTTNRPVIITGMMDDWPAMRKWNLDFFHERFGAREIEVQMGRNAGTNYEIEREKFISKIKFSQFIEMIRSSNGTNDFYLTANNNSSNKKALPELWDDIIQVPEYLDGSDRFGGFFWMGPAGTITPFHHDLTNNFMAQVIGRKRVKIAPSWDMPLMNNDYHVFCRIDGRVTGPNPRPATEEPQILECLLNAGEILFLPIGCLHFVEGVETSVTISFTNF